MVNIVIPECSPNAYLVPVEIYTNTYCEPEAIRFLGDRHMWQYEDVPPLTDAQAKQISLTAQLNGAQGICQKRGRLFATYFSKKEAPVSGRLREKLIGSTDEFYTALVQAGMYLRSIGYDSYETSIRYYIDSIESQHRIPKNQSIPVVKYYRQAKSSFGHTDVAAWWVVGKMFYTFGERNKSGLLLTLNFLRKTMDMLHADIDSKRRVEVGTSDSKLAFEQELPTVDPKDYINLLIELLTAASETKQWDIAERYVKQAKYLPHMEMPSWPDDIQEDIETHRRARELLVLNELYIRTKDTHVKRGVNELLWSIWKGQIRIKLKDNVLKKQMHVKLRDEEPEGPTNAGGQASSSGTPSSPAPAGGSSSPSAAPQGGSSALEWRGQAMADVGGFDASEQDLFSTTSTESATLLYNVTNSTDPSVGVQIVQGSVPTTLGLPTWFTVPMAARQAGAPVH